MINPVQNNMINSYVNNYQSQKGTAAAGVIPPDDDLGRVNKLNYRPVTVGILNGICWTAIGMGFEMICSKLFKSKINNKVSLAVNSLIGLGMGIYAYKLAKKEAQNNIQ